MFQLNNLKSSNRRKKKRVGRGPGSGKGKTSGRGHKGAGSRSGYKKRLSYEGGQERLFKKLPTRGFSRARFKKPCFSINLLDIERLYNDGEVVNFSSLREKGCLSKKKCPIKILAKGEVTKKIKIEANFFSKNALKKLEDKNISYKIIEKVIKEKVVKK